MKQQKKFDPPTEDKNEKTSVEVSATIKLTRTCEANGKITSRNTDTLDVNLNLQTVEEVTRQAVRGAIMGAADVAAKVVVGDGIGESDNFEDPK